MKKCTKCSVSKELDQFTKDKAKKDGIYSSCKQCRSAYIKTDKSRSRDRARYSKRADKLKKYLKQIYLEKTEEIKTRVSKYRALNPEKHRKASLNWQKNNQKRANSNHAKYKAQKILRTPKWLSYAHLAQIRHIYESCPDGYHVDHIIPLRGKEVSGLHVPWNLQILTQKENCSKGNSLERAGYLY
jgi:hypothetical protein